MASAQASGRARASGSPRSRGSRSTCNRRGREELPGRQAFAWAHRPPGARRLAIPRYARYRPGVGFESLGELQSFVRQLDVPEERREIVEAELLDHFFARVASGDPEDIALSAFGDPEALRIRFERVERSFEI